MVVEFSSVYAEFAHPELARVLVSLCAFLLDVVIRQVIKERVSLVAKRQRKPVKVTPIYAN
eukprot:6826258-Lingulodinium_polyedra.AAC.1